jgi:hypothetical protein
MLESTIALFDEYVREAVRSAASGFHRDIAAEFRERLVQAHWLLERARRAEAVNLSIIGRLLDRSREETERAPEAGVDVQNPSDSFSVSLAPIEARENREAKLEMEVMRDAFYFFAFRAQSIATHKSKPLPGLEKFDARGVREVRNQLLAHPEGADSRIFSMGSAWGGQRGPIVKAIREAGKEDLFVDRGLYVNGAEFRDKLEELLREAISRLGACGGESNQDR